MKYSGYLSPMSGFAAWLLLSLPCQGSVLRAGAAKVDATPPHVFFSATHTHSGPEILESY